MTCVTFTACVLVAVIGCKSEEKPKPKPPPPPVDGIEVVLPGAEPHRALRYKLTPKTTTPLDLAMDVDLRTFEVAIQVPTLALALDVVATEVDAAGNAKVKMTIVGASVKRRNDDPKSESIIAIMDRQAALLPGIVIAFGVSPNGTVSASKIEAVGRDLSGPMQEQVATLVQVSEQIAMALPEQPVGVGAEWKHRRTIKQNQLALTSLTTVKLTAIEGDRVTFESTSDLAGADQTITQGSASAQVTQIRGNGSQRGTFDLATATITGEIQASLSFEMVADGQRRPTRFDVVTKIAPRALPADAPADAGVGSASAGSDSPGAHSP